MFSILLFIEFAIVHVFASVIFEDCGSAYDLHTVNIEGCSTRLPCYVTLGDAVPVSVEFFADFSSSKLDQNVVININLLNLNTEVTPDPCEIVDCPVRTNAPTSFTSVMFVPSNIALNQRGYLRWRVFNEQGRLVLCYSVLVQTQSPLQKLLRPYLELNNIGQADDIVKSLDTGGTVEELNKKFNVTLGLPKIIEQFYKQRLIQAK